MVERIQEAAGDPAWVQEFEWSEDSFPFQVRQQRVKSTSPGLGDLGDRGSGV
jgi:hypothetical protein